MSDNVIQFVPRPNPYRDTRTLEQQAIGILNAYNLGFAIPDTAPSEYSAPDDDCA